MVPFDDIQECHKDGTYAVQFVEDGEKDDGIVTFNYWL